MAKISLRDYDREIENQIEAGHTDEAISHCRYILQQFPKHIDTYRLLGKAYLETKRYTEASDVLQRVLSSIPDDFVAHLGMGIIREDEGDLDAAIWHMERAFEAQPANAAIQNELRRLYGRRDGLEPPKVHLTRGALARMYAKGNLYRQAIAEIRTALAEDPQRPDLQVLLAQTYMETNQRVEAVETCSALLNRLPYCLVANRILAKILPDTERASEAKIFRQRVEALDPYAAHLSPGSPATEQVPDSAITMERYIWTPGEILAGAPQPEWASTLGVEIEEEPEEKVPDWLSPGLEAGEESASMAEAGAELEGAFLEEETELPDWLKSDMESPAESKTPPPFFPEAEEETVSAEDLTAGEIPDWVRSMAPSADMEEEALETTIGDEETSQPPVQPFEIEEEAPAEIPDWLRDLEAEASEEIEQAPSDQGKPPQIEAFEQEGIPEWLAGEALETPEEQEEMPDWLKELEEETPPETQPEGAEMEIPEPPEAEAAQLEPAEEQLPEWLEEGGIAEPEEEIPEWLGELEAETEEAVSAEGPEIEEEAEVSEALYETGEEPSPAVPSSQEDEDAALAWLESLAARQGADEEELLTSPEERLETPPEWVQEIPAEEEVVFEEAVEPAESAVEKAEIEAPEAQAPEEEVPDWLRAAQLEGEAPEEAEEIPDWLHGAVEEGPPEEIEAIAEEEAEAIETAAQIPSPSEQVAPEEEALPDWLEEMGGEISEAEVPFEEPVAYEGELPDWLGDLGEEVEEGAGAETEPEPILGDTQPVQVAPQEQVEELAEEPVSEAELFEEAEPGEEIAPEAMEMPSFDQTEEEAAMAWLESLAAKRGVPEEELLTPAEERRETPPEWVQEIEAEQAEATAPEIVAAEEEISEAAPEIGEEIPEEEIPPASEEEYEVTLIEEPQAEVEEEIQIPEVAEEEAAEEPGEVPAERVEAMEEIPEYTMEGEEVLPIEEAAAAPVEAAVEEEQEILAEAGPEIEAEAEELQPAEPELRAEPGLPEWLSEFEMEVSEEEEEPVWQPEAEPSEEEMPVEAAPVEEVEAAEEAEAEAPEEVAPTLININTASLAELERIPGIGFTMAQNIIAHRDTFGPFEEIEDLQQVSGIGPVTIEELKNWVTVEAEELVAAPEDPNQILLNEAREAFSEGDIARAIGQYTDLIKGQQLLDEIVGDLLKAVDRHPVEVSLYQALGDAYMRKDQLQEALDAYSRAEELLR